MPKKLIIAEKPSVANDIARALGGFTRHGDYFESGEFVLSSAIGHLLELIAPEVIVALGKFAAQTLLRNKTPITQLRGRWFDYHGIQLMPTFHPAYLLRNPADKRLVWQDIRQVMERLGLPGGRS